MLSVRAYMNDFGCFRLMAYTSSSLFGMHHVSA